jgi:hypothetical protein
MLTLEELESATLQLDPKSRARIAAALLASLEELSDEENLQLWGEEAQRRSADLDTGRATAQPGPEVLRRAREELG